MDDVAFAVCRRSHQNTHFGIRGAYGGVPLRSVVTAEDLHGANTL